MNKFLKNFKSAFTLAEIGMTLLIISILVLLCIPIVVNQVKKTDEYSYYLAFKTVEKMGSQIVAFGDPGDITPNQNEGNGDDAAFLIKDKLALYANHIVNTLSPKAHASTNPTVILSFPSYEYDLARVCLGNENVVKDYDEQAGNQNWNIMELVANGQGNLCSKFTQEDFLKKRFMCPTRPFYEAMRRILERENLPFENYCKLVAKNCPGAYDCSDPNKNCIKHILLSQSDNGAEYDQCIITIKDDPAFNNNQSLPGSVESTTTSRAVNCSSYGFSGMSNDDPSGSVNCRCDATHPVKAINNTKVCCSSPENPDTLPYYNDSSKYCVYCGYNTFNESTGTCCPAHSYYSKALKHCVCNEGFTSDNVSSPTTCSLATGSCPEGTHLDNGICVSNPPITSAQRLCQLIAYKWNITSSNCSTFSQEGNIKYYKSLYDAITANDTTFLSAKAVEGAFNNIEPNIVFANGLSMWILGDKAASIAGLSYNPDNNQPDTNICYSTNESEAACASNSHYYCKNDNSCYGINAGENELKLSDARNCCSSPDLSDIMHMFSGTDYLKDPRTYAINGFTAFVDITGTKDNNSDDGGGTMWKDVFPFYISSNGKVYPGYPLNAAKAAGDTAYDNYALYQGGNSSALSADVYYYDIVDGKRRRINAYSSIPYARALCFSMSVSAYSPYCQNLGTKYRNSNSQIHDFIYSDDNACSKHRCFVKLKNKIKYL